MISQYHITLCTQRGAAARPEWSYRLYASLLERTPPEFASSLHRDAVTPVSNYLIRTAPDMLEWTVSLLGEDCEDALAAIVAAADQFYLKNGAILLTVTDRQMRYIANVNQLFYLASQCGSVHTLRFLTPTAFKSQGEYVRLPTVRLILQSLIQKWNSCITEYQIEDEAGMGADALARGLRCSGFHLCDALYHLKGNAIPGFVGELTLENRLDGFQRQLANALLLFAAYSGVGIKTGLGMGGTVRSTR